MAIGRTFKEALQKGIRSLEQDRHGLNGDGKDPPGTKDELLERIATPTPDRIFEVEAALRAGATVHEVAAASGIDPWFVSQMAEISLARTEIETLTEVEELEFPKPVGRCEAFVTLGGTSTMPWTYEGKLATLDYKTVRYPGHAAKMRLFRDLGLLETTPVLLEGASVAPRSSRASVSTPRGLSSPCCRAAASARWR